LARFALRLRRPPPSALFPYATLFRSIMSIPLSARGGKPLGIISTHFKEPHRPDPQTLRRLKLYARQAADLIERKQAEQALRESRSEEHTSELQSRENLVCRLLLEKKK